MIDHLRQWRASVRIAITSAIAVIVSVAVNILVDSGVKTSLEITISTILLAAAGLLGVIQYLFTRAEDSQVDFTDYENAVVKRMRAVLHALRDSATLGQFIDIPMSIALRRSGSRDARTDIKTWSALIANLATDPICTIVTGVPGAGKTTLMQSLALEMLNSREQQGAKYIPLFLACRRWSPDEQFRPWLLREVSGRYGIAPRLTSSWLNRGKAVLLLDGIDEVPQESWSLFAYQINSWLKSPIGSRAVLSCREDAYIRYFNIIAHEQVASLQPLSGETMRALLAEFVVPRLHDTTRFDEYRSLFQHVISVEPTSSAWSTPLLIRILASGLLDDELISRSPELAQDPGAVAVMLGDTLSKQGDSRGAITSYLTAANNPSSAWRSLGGARASLLLARSGDYEGARGALQLSLASQLERSMRSEVIEASDELTDDDRAVLNALSITISQDAFQVSSAASIPPTRSNEALRRLRDRGLVDVVDTNEGEPRFCRAPVDLVDR